jgi:Cu+-exporting ATPase
MSIAGWLQGDGIHEALPIESFKETKGQGIEANVQGVKLRIGSASFCSIQTTDTSERTTYFRMGQKTGRFLFSSELREGIPNLLVALNAYPLHLLSGDTDKDRELLQRYFPEGNIHFEQSPQSKYEYIKHLQSEGKNVLMIGDGLNDAGALGIADVGIAVSEDVFRFSPSSDAIIDASKLGKLNCFLNVSNFSKKVLRSCLVFSLAYNAIGLTVACSGKLTPLIAAILMPLSSITVVFISTLLSLSRNKVFKG